MSRSRRPILPWVVWGVAVLAYMIAIVNRSSLAALGPTTQEHFGIDATALSMFAMIQLIVYAGLQIPVGIQLDRIGPTALLVIGGLLMIIGQVVMATVHEVSLAILARVLVGAGDACSFISVIRLLPDWFSVRHLPIVTQLTGLLGQAGQLISVTPLALAVGAFGWTTGFIGIAAVGLFVTSIAIFTLRDRPGEGTLFERMTGRMGRISREATSLGANDNTALIASVAPPPTEMMPVIRSSSARVPGLSFWEQVRRLLSLPGVRLAFWIHFTAPFSYTALVLLWGTPFLTGGVGLDASTARAVLSVTVVSSMVAGILLGKFSSRFVEWRVWISFWVVVLIVVTWSVVLLWPGTPPMGLLIALMVVAAMGGPASMISFEVARSHTPRSFSGFSTGLVNTGGFIASLIVILFIGLALDLQDAGSPELYSLTAFRWALAVQFPFWALGLGMMLLELRRTGRWMRGHGRTLR